MSLEEQHGCGRSRNVPGGALRLLIGVFQLHLLRRARRAGITDRQHPGRVLVGYRYHDDGRLRRQGARWLHRQADWFGVCNSRRADSGYTRADHHRPL